MKARAGKRRFREYLQNVKHFCILMDEKIRRSVCRRGDHPVQPIANWRRGTFLFPVPRDPVLPHYAAGRTWTIAWRIAIIMLRNTDQSNILAHHLSVHDVDFSFT
jgi:hypothetical protein